MDAKITASHWSDPDLQPLSAEMLLTLHWMKTNQDRNDCGAYRFNPALFTFNTKLDAAWHEKTRAALPARFAQDGLWFLYLPFIRECLQLGVAVGKNGGLHLGWKALAKPFQGLPKPFQGLLASEYPELAHVLPQELVSKLFASSGGDGAEGLPKGLASPSEAQEQSRAAKSREDQGECEGGHPVGAEVPDDAAVLDFAATWLDLARGLTGIPAAYALRWLAWRTTEKAGPFPRDWRRDLARRYVADVLEGKTAPPGKTTGSKRLDEELAALRRQLDTEKSPDARAALRGRIRELETAPLPA